MDDNKPTDTPSEQDWEEDMTPADEAGTPGQDSDADPLTSAQEKADENLRGWQRAVADFENYKRRDQEHHKELVAYGQEMALGQFLGVAENLDRVFSYLPETIEQLRDWKIGVEGVRRQLEDMLAEFNIEKIKTVGEAFNPTLHEAIAQVEGGEEGVIAEEVSSGYKRGDKLLKPARVKVFTKSNNSADEAKGE